MELTSVLGRHPVEGCSVYPKLEPPRACHASVWLVGSHRHPHAPCSYHSPRQKFYRSCIVLFCTPKDIYTMWQEYLGLTKQSHWLYSTGWRCFCSKSTSYATLLWRWSATAGIRIPQARTLTHGKHPSDTELFCARNQSTMLRRWGLVGTRI